MSNSSRRVACAPPGDRSRLDHCRADAHGGGRGLLPGLRGRCRDARRLRRVASSWARAWGRPWSRPGRSRPTRRSSASPARSIGGMLFGSVLERAGVRAAPAGHRPPSLGLVDGLAGAVLSIGVALGLVWLAGSVALQAPQARGLRDDIQRSSILRALNDLLPPSGPILNALARFDPFPRIDGPPVDLPGAARGDRARPRGARCGARRGQGPGDRLRPGGGGLGLDRPRRPGGDQRARRRRPERHDGPARRVGAQPAGARRRLRSPRRHRHPARRRPGGRALAIAADPRSGASGAILGFPQNGPYDVRAARLGSTRAVITQDAYGDGPVQRSIVTLRGTVRPGNSGGPRGRRARARGGDRVRRHAQRPRAAATRVPNAVVERDLGRAGEQLGVHRALRRPELPSGVHGQDPRHRREAVRGPGPRPRAARSVREAHRRGGQDRALAGGPRARHHLGRRPPRPARRARRVRRQVQEVADGRSADRAAQLQARGARRALREADEGRARPAAPRRHRHTSSTRATPGARAS